MLFTFVALFVTGLLSTAIVFASMKGLSNSAGRFFESEQAGIRSEIEKFDHALESALGGIDEEASLDVLLAAQKERDAALIELQDAKKRSTEIERQLEMMQERVDKQEMKHAELKRGKEDSDRLADEIRANQERLASERARLEMELKTSTEQMRVLAHETKLSPAQQAALDEIRESLARSLDQVSKLADQREAQAQRFIALESQYVELEKEFRKLVDKELRGEA